MITMKISVFMNLGDNTKNIYVFMSLWHMITMKISVFMNLGDKALIE